MGVMIVTINRITKARYTVLFNYKCCQICDKNNRHVRNILVSITGLYKVEHVYAAVTKVKHIDLTMLHRHLAHIAPDAIHKMINSGVLEGVELTDNGPMATCKMCEQAKAMHKQIWKECEAPLADMVGMETHTDLWGPTPAPSMGGRRYYITFTDDHSHYSSLTVLCMKLATHSSLMKVWSHGARGSRSWSHCLQQKQNTLQRCTPPRKAYGCVA